VACSDSGRLSKDGCCWIFKEYTGLYYVIRSPGSPIVPIYYCIDDSVPRKQLEYAGKNVVWKNVVVKNNSTITCPLPTKLVPIKGTDLSYLFIVLKECGDLPMPVYTYANDTSPQSTASPAMLEKYPLYGTYSGLNGCPTCEGSWNWSQ
jgi:hypothetical protein